MYLIYTYSLIYILFLFLCCVVWITIEMYENCMDTHFIKLGKKLTKSLYFLRRVQNILTKEALLSLYYAIFHAHLLYCPIVTSGISAQVLKKIKILQKKAIRTITKSKSREHTEPLFRQLKILPYTTKLYKCLN